MDLMEAAYKSVNLMCKLLSEVAKKEDRLRNVLDAISNLDNRAKSAVQYVASWGPLNALLFYFSKCSDGLNFNRAEYIGRYVKCERTDYIPTSEIASTDDTVLSYLLYDMVVVKLFDYILKERGLELTSSNFVNMMDEILRYYFEGKKDVLPGEKELIAALQTVARLIELKLLPIEKERNHKRKRTLIIELCGDSHA